MTTQNRSKRNSTRAVWIVAGVSVIVVAGLIGASLLSARGGSETAGAVLSDAELGAVRNVKGPAGAKVTVVEYNDYL